ncbi:pyrroline-5-carboxylate reductase [Cetobacterium sp. 8H]|uniref:pyrroline-5-carboxylate reductase n=1 Tax=Cetobacterium sp. 8H TaxID=2759681 RepID=UPI00163D1023|nr:pyrroline-5-carboxylate reductase [Cetobacterium sp. 8H]MBC2851875.1 pyrroline-5-carboxylate reductase [Cetobacterium sp. 8H]
MKNIKIGFIGAGNMAQAMLKGMLNNSEIESKNIFVYDLNDKLIGELEEKYGVSKCKDQKEVAKSSDIIILAVKPNIYPLVIDTIKNDLDLNKIVVSITPGYSIKELKVYFEKNIKIVRTMPNTPAMVGEGMTAYCVDKSIDENDENVIKSILETFGKVEKVEEKLMDVVVATSGSSPAYVYMFIEALADGAVLGGMPRDKAYIFAAQTVLGAAQMVIKTGIHPGALKDMVCSPGGTTIEAVATLEENGFRSSVIQAMKRCIEKSKKMNLQ